MPLFLSSIREPSSCHRVVSVEEGFMILPQSGFERQFDELARETIEHVGPFRAFARRGEDGLYESVHILPEEYAALNEDRSFDHPSGK